MFNAEGDPFTIVIYKPEAKVFNKVYLENKEIENEEMDENEMDVRRFDAFLFACSKSA